jgi:hypothetical protein
MEDFMMKVNAGNLLKKIGLAVKAVAKEIKCFYITMASISFGLFIVFYIIAATGQTSVVACEATVVEDVELPNGYSHFGRGEWISNTEWVGRVVDSRGVSGISGDSKECRIYNMHIFTSGYTTYYCEPLYEMGGTPATIYYDGIAFE